MQTRLLRWNYSIISKFVNGLYNTLHRITCTLHKLKSRFSLELPTRFQSIHQWKGCIMYIVSRIKHTQYSCNKTIKLSIFMTNDVDPDPVGSAFIWACGSGSRGIKWRKKQSLTNKIHLFFHRKNILLKLFFLILANL